MPAPTREGKNIFACKVDGVVHIYSGEGTIFNPDGVSYQPTPDDIFLAGSKKEYNDFVSMTLPNLSLVTIDTTYRFSTETSEAHGDRYTGNNGTPFRTKNGSGWVRFSRLDTSVAAGTFAFTGYRDGDSSVITEGVFDLKNRFR